MLENVKSNFRPPLPKSMGSQILSHIEGYVSYGGKFKVASISFKLGPPPPHLR